MHWKKIFKRIILWFGFSIGLMILPVVLSIVMYKVIGIPTSIGMYTKELLFISVTLASTSLNDVFSLTRKGIQDLFLTSLLVSLVLIALFCISLYMIVSTCAALNHAYDIQIVNNATIVFGMVSFIISGCCQVIMANIEEASE